MWLLRLGRGLTFFFDEWDFILGRSYSIDDLLRPHNGHLSLLPVLAFNFLREVFGISSYLPYQILGLLIHGSVCSAIYALGKRRSAALSIVAAVVVCLLGSGWQNIMWPFQIGMMGALSAGLWAIWEVTNDEVSSKRLALLCLISLLCAGGGVTVLATIALLVLYRRQWTSLKYLVLIAAGYLSWYLKFGVSQSVPGNLRKVPRYVYDSAVGSAAGIGSFDLRYVVFFFLILATLVLWNIVKKTTAVVGLACLVMAIITFSLTGLSRAHLSEPAASRYVYVGAILLIGTTISLVPIRLNNFVVLLLAVAAVVPIQSNLKTLKAGYGGLHDVSLHVRSSLTGLEMISGPIVLDETLDGARAPQFDARQYRELSETAGKAGFLPKDLLAQPEIVRLEADDVLFRFMDGLSRESSIKICEDKRELKDSEIILMPGETINLVAYKGASATFRWFTETIESSAVLEMKPAIQYQFSNHVYSGTRSLVIAFSLPDIVICS